MNGLLRNCHFYKNNKILKGKITITIKAGDTPSGLAKKYGVSVADIMKGAGITDPRKLIAGKTITVTNSAGSLSKMKQCLKSEPANNSSSRNANSPPAPASPNPRKPDKEPDDEDKDNSGSVFQKSKAYEEYEWYENVADTTQALLKTNRRNRITI